MRPALAAVLVALVGCSVSCSADAPHEPGAAAVADADQVHRKTGPRDVPCDGVTIATRNNPHAILRAHPPGTTYCFLPGVHRLDRPLRPQQGDTLAGRPGAALNGSKVLQGWRHSPDGWTASAHIPPDSANDGPCLTGSPLCGWDEDVFLQDQRLTRVGSLEKVGPDSFYADDDANTVTIGSDPTGLLVEQAVARSLVKSAEANVTVRDLILEKAANGAQVAAVDSRIAFPRAGPRWRVLHNDVRLNHGVGVGVGSHGRVRANLISQQGQLGVALWGAGVRLTRNEIAYNGLVGYDPEWEAGGVKSWKTRAAVISGNHVHHNHGPGLWSDGGCDGTRYTHNLVTDNWMAGIQHEISYDALIAYNEVLRNGSVPKGWAWDAGIQIQSSGGNELIDVRHNVVSGNAHGIVVLDSSDRRRETPHPSGPHVVQNVLVRDNVVVLHAGQWTGLFHDYGNHEVFRRGIRFVDNTYYVDDDQQRSFGWKDELLTWEQWRAAGSGHDQGGHLDVEAQDSTRRPRDR